MSQERKPLNYSGIFLDSADLNELAKWLPILGGATTNPGILKKEGVFDIGKRIQDMIEITKGDKPGFPISVEIPSTTYSITQMLDLAHRYHERFPETVVVKVPIDPQEPEKAFAVLHTLAIDGIRTNATIGLTMGELIGAAEASRDSYATGDNYISLFWGRRNQAKYQMIEDELTKYREELNKDGKTEETIEKELQIKKAQLGEDIVDASVTLTRTLQYLRDHNLHTRVIVGSVREPYQVEQAFESGADIVTIPPKVLQRWMFTKRGVETVDEFNQAYKSVEEEVILI